MSDDDTINPANEGALLAAEYVLGVLGAQERREVERRLAQEPALASEVAYWEGRLGGLADAVAPMAPPAAAWSRIEAAIATPLTGARHGLWQSLAFWRSFAIGSTAVAAASLAALGYIGLVPAPRAPLLATLGGSGGQPSFVAAIGAGGSLTVVPASLLAADQRSYELWLIPPGDRPHSLGLIEPGRPVHLTVPPALVPRVTTDAALAVSLEPPGGSPTGQPTGPVIASGKLINL
jgi:anti-sigma-K factor RskA